jgi:hypothetical protein
MRNGSPSRWLFLLAGLGEQPWEVELDNIVRDICRGC